MENWLDKRRPDNCQNPENGEEMSLCRVGSDLYEKVFKHYTKKQWDKYPEGNILVAFLGAKFLEFSNFFRIFQIFSNFSNFFEFFPIFRIFQIFSNFFSLTSYLLDKCIFAALLQFSNSKYL